MVKQVTTFARSASNIYKIYSELARRSCTCGCLASVDIKIAYTRLTQKYHVILSVETI